jgi:hypothetical protein
MRLLKFLRTEHTYYIKVLLAFLFFLLTLPHVNALAMRCLKHIPGQTYTYEQCTTQKALDQFIAIALLGLGVSLGFIYARSRQNGYKAFVFLAIILTGVTIGAYYVYIPQVVTTITETPVYLDSLQK